MTIFSGQSVISRVYTSRFGNGTARWNLDRSGTKKVSGTRYSTQWKTPQKWTVPYRTVPYHAVEKRHKLDKGSYILSCGPRSPWTGSTQEQLQFLVLWLRQIQGLCCWDQSEERFFWKVLFGLDQWGLYIDLSRKSSHHFRIHKFGFDRYLFQGSSPSYT